MAGRDFTILSDILFLAVGQPLQINLRLDNNPTALHRDGHRHPGDKVTLFKPAAFKINCRRRVEFTILLISF